MTFASRGLSWAFAAVLAVAMPAAHSAWAVADSATAKMLGAQLPAGVTLAKASISQTAAAVSAAVSQRPDKAVDIVQVAIMAKTPKQGHGELSCDNLLKIAKAGISAAPDKSSEIVQMAASLHPECADALNSLVATANNGSGLYGAADDYAFGVGFGPGFPGSPGFVGSAPSGAFALPPVTPKPVTSTTNG